MGLKPYSGEVLPLGEEVQEVFVSPVTGKMSGGFGDKRDHGPHRAGDLSAPAGSSIVAPETIKFVQGGRGGTNLRDNDWWSHWEGVDTGVQYRFAHHDDISGYRPGDTVPRGEQWNVVGGAVDDPHLHMALHDPVAGKHIDWATPLGLKRGAELTQGKSMLDGLERKAGKIAATVPSSGKLKPYDGELLPLDTQGPGLKPYDGELLPLDAEVQAPVVQPQPFPSPAKGSPVITPDIDLARYLSGQPLTEEIAADPTSETLRQHQDAQDFAGAAPLLTLPLYPLSKAREFATKKLTEAGGPFTHQGKVPLEHERFDDLMLKVALGHQISQGEIPLEAAYPEILAGGQWTDQNVVGNPLAESIPATAEQLLIPAYFRMINRAVKGTADIYELATTPVQRRFFNSLRDDLAQAWKETRGVRDPATGEFIEPSDDTLRAFWEGLSKEYQTDFVLNSSTYQRFAKKGRGAPGKEAAPGAGSPNKPPGPRPQLPGPEAPPPGMAGPQSTPEPLTPAPTPTQGPVTQPANAFQGFILQTGGHQADPAVLAHDFLETQPPGWSLSPEGLSEVTGSGGEVKHLHKELALVYGTLNPELAKQMRPDEIWRHLTPENMEAIAAIPRGKLLLDRLHAAVTDRMAEAQGELQVQAAEVQQQAAEEAEKAALAPPVDKTRPAKGTLFTPEQIKGMTHAEYEALPPEQQKRFDRDVKAEQAEKEKKVGAKAEKKPALRKVKKAPASPPAPAKEAAQAPAPQPKAEVGGKEPWEKIPRPTQAKFRTYGTVEVQGQIAYKIGRGDLKAMTAARKVGYTPVGGGTHYEYWTRGEPKKYQSIAEAMPLATEFSLEPAKGGTHWRLYNNRGEIFSSVRETKDVEAARAEMVRQGKKEREVVKPAPDLTAARALRDKFGASRGVGKPTGLVTKDSPLSRASDRGDLRGVIKGLGGIKSTSRILKNFDPGERKKLIGLIRTDGMGADVLADTINKEYSHLGYYETDADLIRTLVDGTYKKLLNENILAEEEAYYARQIDAEVERTGVPADDLTEAERIAEAEVAREEITGRSVKLEEADLSWDFDEAGELIPEKKAAPEQPRLSALQEAHPELDPKRLELVLKTFPDGPTDQIVRMAKDPKVFDQLRRQRLQKMSDAGGDADQMQALPGMGGLFGPKYTLKQARALAPTFYSQMATHLETKLPGKGNGPALADLIEGWAAKGQFKADELHFSGLIPWLKEQTGPVMRHQITEKLKEGEVRVQVVEKGGRRELAEEANKIGMKYGTSGNILDNFDKPEYHKFLATKEGGKQTIAPDDAKRLMEIRKALDKAEPTKFQSYLTDLPESFTNRREMLLTVPRKQRFLTKEEFWEETRGFPIKEATDTALELFDNAYRNYAKRGGTLETPGDYKVPGAHAYNDPAADVNRFAHVFTADYVDPATGKKSLVVTETQSDWAREGRAEGYGDKELISYHVQSDQGVAVIGFDDRQAADDYVTRRGGTVVPVKVLAKGVPPLPFAKNWHEVALKQVVRKAAEEGYDGVLVVNGEMVKSRYDLKKILDKNGVQWSEKEPGQYIMYATAKGGERLVDGGMMGLEEIEKTFGKGIREQIEKATKTWEGPMTPRGQIAGGELSIGGEWANRLYDKTIPSFLRKYVKQWDVSVGRKDVEFGGGFDPEDNVTYPSDEIQSLTHVPIPQSMKDSVLYRGQPLYKPKEIPGEKTAEAAAGTAGGVRDISLGDSLLAEGAEGQRRQVGVFKSALQRINPRDYRRFWKDVEYAEELHGSDEMDGPIRLAAKFGIKTVIPVKGAGFDGVLMQLADGPVILLDRDTSPGVTKTQTVGHEIFHDMVENRDPNALKLLAMIDPASPVVKAYQVSLDEVNGFKGSASVEHTVEEIAADYFGGILIRTLTDGSTIRLKDAFRSPLRAFEVKTRINGQARRGVTYMAKRGPPETDLETKKTSTKNAVTEEERRVRGLDPVQKELFQVEPGAAEAKRLVDEGIQDPRELAARIAKSIHSGKQTPITDVEGAMLMYDRMRLYNAESTLMDDLEKALTEGGDVAAVRQQLAVVADALDLNDRAVTHAGTVTSASFRMRQYFITQDYSLARILQRARVAHPSGELPDALREKLTALTLELQAANKKLEAYEKGKAEKKAKQSVKDIEQRIDRAIRKGEAQRKPKVEAMANFKSLAEKFRDTLGQLNMLLGPNQVALLAEMAKELVIAGVTDAKMVVNTIFDELNIPDLSKRDVEEALSGYGKVSKPSQDEIDKALREVRRQIRLFLSLEDALSGQMPQRTGLQRDPVSDEVRALTREVKQAMRDAGIDSTSSRTPEEQWKTSLDAVKTRLNNQIRDNKKRLEDLKAGRPVLKKKGGLTYDQEAADLKAENDMLLKAIREIEGKPGMSGEQKLRMATEAVEKSIANWERRIKEGDLSPAKKGSTTPETPQLHARRTYRDRLRKVYQQMKRDAQPTIDPEVAALRRYKAYLLKRDAQLQNMLDTGNFEKSAKRVLNIDPEADRLKANVEAKKHKIEAEIFKRKMEARSTLSKGLDWGFKFRRGVILSGVGTLGKLAAAATMRQISTPLEDFVGAAIRMVPYMKSMFSLAPTEGGGINVRAEAAGFVQWFKKQTWQESWGILKMQPTELELLYGKHRPHLPDSWLDWFGHMHQALKNPIKRVIFYRTLQRRTEWAMNHGIDMTHPANIMAVSTAAYLEGNRAIFMNDNFASKAFFKLIRELKATGQPGLQTLATALQFLMPIVKVPTNFTGEVLSYTVGPLMAASRYYGRGGAKGMKLLAEHIEKHPNQAFAPPKGFKGMSTDDADYIARNLKKGGLGMLLFLLGMAGAASVGGYWVRGEKREMADVKPGDIRLFGLNISHLFLHHPAIFGPIMLGATIKRVMGLTEKGTQEAQAKAKEKGSSLADVERAAKAEEKGSGMAEGLRTGAIGIAKGVPFIDTPIRMAQASENWQGMEKFAYQLLESLITPPDLRRIAKATDKAGEELIPRGNKTLGQVIRGSIPGQRGKLSLDVNRMKRLPLDRLAEIVDNAPAGTISRENADILAKSLDGKLKRQQWDLPKPEMARYEAVLKKLDTLAK